MSKNGCSKKCNCKTPSSCNCTTSATDTRVLAKVPVLKVLSCEFPSMHIPTIPKGNCFDKNVVGFASNTWAKADVYRCIEDGVKQSLYVRTTNGVLDKRWVNDPDAPVECDC